MRPKAWRKVKYPPVEIEVLGEQYFMSAGIQTIRNLLLADTDKPTVFSRIKTKVPTFSSC